MKIIVNGCSFTKWHDRQKTWANHLDKDTDHKVLNLGMRGSTNQEIIDKEVNRIVTDSQCDWLDDLITAVFISHTKILASLGNNSKKVNLTIPKITNFIHKCYINSAREMWKNPYLYDENVSSSEYQKNIKIIEDLIEESIEQTIRKALPVKEILRDHFEHSEIAEKRNREVACCGRGFVGVVAVRGTGTCRASRIDSKCGVFSSVFPVVQCD